MCDSQVTLRLSAEAREILLIVNVGLLLFQDVVCDSEVTLRLSGCEIVNVVVPLFQDIVYDSKVTLRLFPDAREILQTLFCRYFRTLYATVKLR